MNKTANRNLFARFFVCIHQNADFRVSVRGKEFSLVRMKLLVTRIPLLLLALPVSALATNAVVNLSHYDTMRVDFPGMKSEGKSTRIV